MFSMSRWRVVAGAVARWPGGVVCVVVVLAAAVACLVGGAAMAWAGVGRKSVDVVVAGVLYLLAGGEFWWALALFAGGADLPRTVAYGGGRVDGGAS